MADGATGFRGLAVAVFCVPILLVSATACGRSNEAKIPVARDPGSDPVGGSGSDGASSTTEAPVSPGCTTIRAFNFADFAAGNFLQDPKFSPTDPKVEEIVAQLNAGVDTVANGLPSMKDVAQRRTAFVTRMLHGEALSGQDADAAVQANRDLVEFQNKECPPTSDAGSPECQALTAFNFAVFSMLNKASTKTTLAPAASATYGKNLDESLTRVKTLIPSLADPAVRRADLAKRVFAGETLSEAEKAQAETVQQQLTDGQTKACPAVPATTAQP
jgi:hypothetical protein